MARRLDGTIFDCCVFQDSKKILRSEVTEWKGAAWRSFCQRSFLRPCNKSASCRPANAWTAAKVQKALRAAHVNVKIMQDCPQGMGERIFMTYNHRESLWGE